MEADNHYARMKYGQVIKQNNELLDKIDYQNNIIQQQELTIKYLQDRLALDKVNNKS